MLELDRTRVAIKERGYMDVLDLALRLSRVHAWPLLLSLAAGAVPMMLLNGWLLADYTAFSFGPGVSVPYVFYMGLLVVLEAPLATAPITLYLGKAVFTERPGARTIAGEFWQSLSQLLVYQVLLRILSFRWAYLNEVILLERNPMRRKPADGESTGDRARILHRGEGGDFVTRGFSAATVGGLLFASIWLSIFTVRRVLLSQWEWEFDTPMYTLYLPMALWLAVGYLTVVRFLSYLDLRIRREGWEVELWMRAERARLTRRLK